MTMFLQAEEVPPVEVATNTGWGLFSKAARRRKAGTELIGLVDDGISEDPAALRQDIKALLKAVPDQNLRDIARNVLDFLDDGPRLVMTSDGRELDVGGEVPSGPTTHELVLGTFCPTGEGGGVDPSCSPKRGGKSKSGRLANEKHQQLLEEIEKRFRERTPARTMADGIQPEDRVNRSEMSQMAHRLGIEYPIGDDDFDRAVFKLFDRLRKEFPEERWEPRKNWSARTKIRRKELGLNEGSKQ